VGSWYSLTSPFPRYIYQTWAACRNWPPPDQSHFAAQRDRDPEITYSDRRISYQSLPGSIELLKLAKPPSQVSVGGRSVAAAHNLDAPTSWMYNPKSQVLLIRHSDPQVDVDF